MRNKRRVASAAVMALAAAGTMLATTTSALAAPGNCNITFPDANHIASLCTTGTGHHQVDIVFESPRFGRQAAVGNIAAVGEYSIAFFPSGVTIDSYWVNLTDS